MFFFPQPGVIANVVKVTSGVYTVTFELHQELIESGVKYISS